MVHVLTAVAKLVVMGRDVNCLLELKDAIGSFTYRRTLDGLLR
jgi:hypothetical protein